MAVVQDVVGLGHEDRPAPEIMLVIADEPGGEDEARSDRPDRQKQQRHQHHRRALMRLQRTVVGVIVMGMVAMGMVVSMRGVVRLDLVVMRMIVVMRVLPDRLVVEGHEHQTP